MDHYFYNLSSGADVYNLLSQLEINDNSTSFLISAVGDLSKVSFKCPLNQKPIIIEKKLEIITLSGYLRSKESHIHVSVSDDNCRVFGGHLLSGSTVLKSLDILIGVIPDLKQKSLFNAKNDCSCVDIYVLPDCPWSKKAYNILDSYNIKYNSYLITNDDDFVRIRNRTSMNTFPQIFINNQFIGGYSELSNLSLNGDLIELIY